MSSLCRILFLVFLSILSSKALEQTTPDELLALGDSALASEHLVTAVQYYRQGIEQLTNEDTSLLTELSLYTNLATAISSQGLYAEAVTTYETGLQAYKDNIDEIVDNTVKSEADAIAAQAAFFLGMTYQDIGKARDAADAYTLAHQLDPQHWASLANLGAVLHDDLAMHAQALQAYNQAYAILTNPDVEPTDPPPEPRFILSQLQYRMGLCIAHHDFDNQKCVVEGQPDSQQTCKELATHAFALAVEYDPSNESAKHMLASITADATLKRASNTYVQSLFDEYAANFEHSLVEELGYTGFERLRRAFDKAFNEEPPRFDLVVDAGCGTGLVGEQFRNISQTLIGVDLSHAILDEALKARPTLYDEVVAGDVTHVFEDRQKSIDLIIAADSYIYFGDLDPLFASMQTGLRTGGYAAFTLENVDSETEQVLATTKPDWRWQLTASGRFAHSKDYVLEVGRAHGLELVHYEPLNDFRFEKGVGVRGHMFVLQKKEETIAPHNDEL